MAPMLIYSLRRMDSEDTMTDVRIQSPRLARHGRTAAALIALAALGGVACARNSTPAAAAAPMAAAAPGALPVAVNCGPGQQALIRPSLVNGQTISQVDCVAVAPTALAPAAVAPAPAQAAYPVSYPAAPQPVAMSDVATIEERPVYRQARRPAAYRTTEYVPERRVVKSGRSWQKSALIIGSSAGIGAGVGAAAGGKKGALIGAAVGGGGATIWDQVTRRN
jgi:hypothetical protein